MKKKFRLFLLSGFVLSFSASTIVFASVVEIPLFDTQMERKPLPVPDERPSGGIRIQVSSYQPSDLVTPTRSGQEASSFKRKDLPLIRFQSLFSSWTIASNMQISPVMGISFLRLERSGALSAQSGGIRTEQNALLLSALLGGELRIEPIQKSRLNLFAQSGIQPSLFFSQRTAISSEQSQGAFPLFATLGVGIPLFFKTDLVLAFESVFFSGGSTVNLNGSGVSAGIQFRL